MSNPTRDQPVGRDRGLARPLVCRICHTATARRGRRDQRCPTCAAYWHRYHRDRTEQIVVRNNVRRFEQAHRPIGTFGLYHPTRNKW